jgi:DNA-3-methyladenine glycosylase I
MEPERCAWCGTDPLYVGYHDLEWGIPLHDDRRLFEMLILEGAQAGLNWLTILRKREHYRAAFDGFDPERIARCVTCSAARAAYCAEPAPSATASTSTASVSTIPWLSWQGV